MVKGGREGGGGGDNSHASNVRQVPIQFGLS